MWKTVAVISSMTDAKISKAQKPVSVSFVRGSQQNSGSTTMKNKFATTPIASETANPLMKVYVGVMLLIRVKNAWLKIKAAGASKNIAIE